MPTGNVEMAHAPKWARRHNMGHVHNAVSTHAICPSLSSSVSPNIFHNNDMPLRLEPKANIYKCNMYIGIVPRFGKEEAFVSRRHVSFYDQGRRGKTKQESNARLH